MKNQSIDPRKIRSFLAITFKYVTLIVLIIKTDICGAYGQSLNDQNFVTIRTIESRIKEVQETFALDDTTKNRLLDLYKQTITNLELVVSNDENIEEFQFQGKDFPDEIIKVQLDLDSVKLIDPTSDLHDLSSISFAIVRRLLEESKVKLIATEVSLSRYSSRIEWEVLRPQMIHRRLSNLRAENEQVINQLEFDTRTIDNPFLSEAIRWNLESQIYTIGSQMNLLEKELLTHENRVSLLNKKRELTSYRFNYYNKRVELIRSARDNKLIDFAFSAKRKIEAINQAHPNLNNSTQSLFLSIIELADVMQNQVEELDALLQKEAKIQPKIGELEQSYSSTKKKLEIESINVPIGNPVIDQRSQLPKVESYIIIQRQIQEQISTINIRLIHNEEDMRVLKNNILIDSNLVYGMGVDSESMFHRQINDLIDTKQALLEKVISIDYIIQERLENISFSLQKLINRTSEYDDYLIERLVWVRSSTSISTKSFLLLFEELNVYFSSPNKKLLTQSFIQGLRKAPYYLIFFFLAAVLIYYRKLLLEKLRKSSRYVRKKGKDKISMTVSGLIYTIIIALPIPLVLSGIGMVFRTAHQQDSLTFGIALAFQNASFIMLFLLFLINFLDPNGVAKKHFFWNSITVSKTRSNLIWLVFALVPLAFIFYGVINIGLFSFGGSVRIFISSITVIFMLVFVIRVFNPHKGAISYSIKNNKENFWWKSRQIWFLMIILIPILNIILVFVGYTYTASITTSNILQTIAFIILIKILRDLGIRSLTIASNQLSSKVDVENIQNLNEAEGGFDSISKTENISELDADSRILANFVTVVIFIIGLIGIWSDLFPAISIFKDVVLWNNRFIVDGVSQVVTVTLVDLINFFIIVSGGILLSKNLPSLLHIILRKNANINAGSIYAIVTLVRYSLVFASTLLALGTLGASWAQLGWIAAALGVGIGFGLQEIVANFISGLILLFERPLRVGDIITIGEASGMVTKIQIRATTIQDWDQKELLVPNKDLITTKMLNWTLSDSLTRIVIPVGIAYSSDVSLAKKLLLLIAKDNKKVLQDPEPSVIFDDFGDSSLNLELRIHVKKPLERLPVMTEIREQINIKFKESKISIAFPQRDLHVYWKESKKEKI